MRLILIMTSIMLATASTSLLAANNDKTLPNGQPFQILQEQADATNAAVDAANAAQAASVKALEAADAALKARDDMLQGQVDEINKTLSEKLSIIDNRFNQLENEIGQVAQDSAAADSLLSEQIELLQTAISTVNGRLDAVDKLNYYQDRRLHVLETRSRNIVIITNKDRYNASLRFRDLANAITNAMGRANSAYNLASAAYNLADDDAQYNALATKLAAVQSRINTLDNSLGDYCGPGYYVVGVTNSGDLRCRTLTATASVTKNLTKYKYCVTRVVGCVDYKYYQYGTVYCPSGYKRDYTSYNAPGGVSRIDNTDSSAYLKTKTTDGVSSSTGSVRVQCSKKGKEQTAGRYYY